MKNLLGAYRPFMNSVVMNAPDDGGSAAAGDAASILFGGETPDAPAPNAEDSVAKPSTEGENNNAAPDGAGNEEKKAEADGENKDEKKSEDPLDQVPEDGKYTLTMPEGVELDSELLDALSPKLAAKKLTTREAQELADEFIKVQQEREAKRLEGFSKTVATWAKDAEADPEIGGNNWETTVTNARRAVERLGTPALREYFEVTGGGNHPEVIRMMAKVGAMIREDVPASGGAEGAGKPAEAAYTLFPTDAPKGK